MRNKKILSVRDSNYHMQAWLRFQPSRLRRKKLVLICNLEDCADFRTLDQEHWMGVDRQVIEIEHDRRHEFYWLMSFSLNQLKCLSKNLIQSLNPSFSLSTIFVLKSLDVEKLFIVE